MTESALPKCLFPNCKRKVVRRGLCNTCYQTAYRLVQTERTTWKELEDKGKAISAPPKKGQITEWFLQPASAPNP